MKLLWADDQIEEAKTFAATLDGTSIDVRFAASGMEAYDAVCAGDVDVVLVDLRMPPGEWGGLWFLERLALTPTPPPAIVVSGEGSQQETIQAMRLGAVDYVEKRRLNNELPARLESVATRAMLDLVDADESDRLEFKQTLRTSADTGAVNRDVEAGALKTIAAFANGSGGTLVVGRAEDRSITGIDQDLKTLRRADTDYFERHARGLITERMGAFTNGLVTVRFPAIRGVVVAVVRVNAADQPVFVEKGNEASFYLRTGNATRSLNVADAHRYIRNRFSSEASDQAPRDSEQPRTPPEPG